MDENYKRAKRLLDENVDKLHTMAKALVKYETIGEAQIKDIMEGREPRPPEDWHDEPGPTEDSGPPGVESESQGPIGGPASEH